MNKKIKIVIFDIDDTLIYTIDTAYKKKQKKPEKEYLMLT